MTVPMPGKASRLSKAHAQALERLKSLRGGGAKNVFISIHQGKHGNRRGYKRAHKTEQNPGQIEQARDQEQPEQAPPVSIDHFTAQLHGGLEIQPLVDDERECKFPSHTQVNSGHKAEEGADQRKNPNHERSEEQLQKSNREAGEG